MSDGDRCLTIDSAPVPIAVTAITQATFAKQQIEDAVNLNGAVPNLQISRNQGAQNGAQIFLRGIGQDNSTSVDEPAVGIYFDNVYYGRAIGGIFDINDLQQIEVLRGLQGTLYGRNWTGGAIKLEATSQASTAIISRPTPPTAVSTSVTSTAWSMCRSPKTPPSASPSRRSPTMATIPMRSPVAV